MNWIQTAQGALQALTGNAWAGQLQPASWRDIAFHVDSIDVTAGDNVVLREYPFQDLPTVFRMGEGAEEIKFSAYVIGPDYQQQRDALRQALTGEGILIHPTSGAVRCWVNGKYTIREAPAAEGGMARFDLSFVRAEPRRYPRGAVNTADASIAAAIGMARTATALFSTVWNLRGQPGWVASRLLGRLDRSLGVIFKALQPLLAMGGDWADTAAGSSQRLQAALDTTAANPSDLAAQIADVLAPPPDLPGLIGNDASLQQPWLDAFEWAFDLSSKLPETDFETVRQPVPDAGMDGLAMYGTGLPQAAPAASEARVELDRMDSALLLFLRCLGLAAMLRVCAASTWDDVGAARAMRNRVHQLLLDLLRAGHGFVDAADGGDWYAACLRAHGAALADFAARANLAQQQSTVTLNCYMPVWKLSYALYGTPEYADEILAANPDIDHPLLVPPGVALRVVKR